MSGRGILVSAPASGTGKTSFACGLVAALRRRGLPVRAAKCGPDYLDPMWLERASGSPCPNLDPWMAGPDGVRELAAGEGFLVVEGAMGLYDGIRPDSDEGSAAEVASILGIPVVAVVDVSGTARTAAAVVRGLADLGGMRLAGVVANRAGSVRHVRLVGEALVSCGLPPLLGGLLEGALPSLPERHLGLVPPRGDDDLFSRLADAVEAAVDLDALVATAAPLPPAAPDTVTESGRGLRLGLSWDEAFRFAYPPTVRALEDRGVEVVRFSPLADPALPEGLDGLWLCGGYPELHAEDLSGNASMRDSVRGFCASGRPVLAECGGLLYLARTLSDTAGRRFPLCGVVPADGSMGSRLRSLGYREATALEGTFLAPREGSLRGHEFHYGELAGEPAGSWRRPHALSGARGPLGSEGWWNGSVLATWFHGWLRRDDVLERWIAALRAAKEGTR